METTDRFLSQVRRIIESAKDSLVKLDSSDASIAVHHASIKGMIKGLEEASSLYKKVHKVDGEID